MYLKDLVFQARVKVRLNNTFDALVSKSNLLKRKQEKKEKNSFNVANKI